MNTINQSIPFVIEKTANGERSYDLGSRLLQDRVIMLDNGFDDHMAHIVKMQLIWLDSQKHDPITIYINSPGGSVHAGLGIADVVSSMVSPIRTVVMGMAASMGCYMQSTMGTPGLRLAGKRAQIMAHQVSSATQGTLADQKISLAHSERLDDLLGREIADAVGVTYKKYKADTIRDLWLTAEEALQYGDKGFIDGILTGERNEDGQHKVKRRDGSFDWV
jgi:ATP-dependent Clp protease protease subunit